MHKKLFCTTEKPQKITEISRKCHGKSRKITENHGKSRKGFFRPITEIVEALLDVPKVFQELGYIDPMKAKLRVHFQFLTPAVPVGDALPPKPKPTAQPKLVARELSMASFLSKS